MTTYIAIGNNAFALFQNLAMQITNGEIPLLTAYTTRTAKNKKNMAKIAWTILSTLSGNEPMALIDAMLTNVQKCQMEPLKTVCLDFCLPFSDLFTTYATINRLSRI